MSTVSSTFDTDLAQRRSNARLAAPERKRDVDRGRERERKNEREILGESLREDRWIWSALGIHRVPYEFWKVGTWKPAVNARSTDSRFFSLRPLRPFRPSLGIPSDIPTAHRRESRTETRSYNLPGLASRVILGSTLCHCRRRPCTLFVIPRARLSTVRIFISLTFDGFAISLRPVASQFELSAKRINFLNRLPEKSLGLQNQRHDFCFFTENTHLLKGYSKCIHRIKYFTELFCCHNISMKAQSRDECSKTNTVIFSF